jgi:hypothetical protein
MGLDKFKESCLKGYCKRGSFVSKNCQKAYKQEDCFRKFNNKNSEVKVDDAYEEFRKQVWIDDTGSFDGKVRRKDWKNYCKLWNILTQEQKVFIIKNYAQEIWLNENLDVAHIKPKGSYPELKYDPLNGVVLGRYFHNLLDNYIHPITKQSISIEERIIILTKIKKGETI